MQERVVQFAFESLLIGGLRLIEAIKRDVAPMSVVASNDSGRMTRKRSFRALFLDRGT